MNRHGSAALTKRAPRLEAVLAILSLLAFAAGCACGSPDDPAQGEYAVTGKLVSVPAEPEGSPRSMTGAKVHLLLDLEGMGTFEDAPKFEGRVDAGGWFEVGTGTLEIADDRARRALLVATLEEHAVAYKVLHLQPETRPSIELRLFEQSDLRIEGAAFLEDQSIVIAAAGEEIGGGRARLFDPLGEPDAISGGHANMGALLSFGSVSDVVLFGPGGEPLSGLGFETELRMEISGAAWGALEVFPPGSSPAPDGVQLEPEDCCVHGPGLMMREDDPDYRSTALVPLLAFDPGAGAWIFGAVGTLETAAGEAITYGDLSEGLSSTQSDRLFVTAEVPHFSQWAYGWPAAKGCMTGKVVHESGKEAAGVTITGRLERGSILTGPVVTNENGEFCIPSPGVLEDEVERFVLLHAFVEGERVLLDRIPIARQHDMAVSCGVDECQQIEDDLVLRAPGSEPTGDCTIDLLFPERTWVRGGSGIGVHLDLDLEIFGSGFGVEPKVYWNLGREDQKSLEPWEVHDDRLLVTVPHDLLSVYQYPREATIDVLGEGLDCSRAFHIGGVVPDTGQRTCSDSRVEQPCPEDAGMPFHGQDAQYGLDLHVADETRRFHSRDDNENGQWVVLDRVTQLQWQRCPPGLMGEQCEEEHNLHYSALSFQDAEEYCALLADARYGGLSEWRVPKVHELWSIVNHDTGEPAAYHVFPATLASAYWSATSRAGFHDNDYLWTVDFFDGLTDGRRSDSSHLSVRCVSPNRHLPRGELRRVEESDSVVVDSGTGLTWQGCVFGQEGEICDAAGAEPMIWEHALSSCQGLDWAGYGDWRLPSINEIMSIVDYTRNDPAIGPALSSGIELLPTGALLWSSTSSLGSRQAEPALMVHSGGGHSEARAKSENAYVICVRGGP